jgi:hypothetical protein
VYLQVGAELDRPWVFAGEGGLKTAEGKVDLVLGGGVEEDVLDVRGREELGGWGRWGGIEV